MPSKGHLMGFGGVRRRANQLTWCGALSTFSGQFRPKGPKVRLRRDTRFPLLIHGRFAGFRCALPAYGTPTSHR